jgi:heat shock protein HslJ
MKKTLIIAFMFGLTIAGCKKDKQAASPFLDTEWTLTSIENVSTKLSFNFPADADRKITLVFPESGVVSFTGICNTGTGNFTIDYFSDTYSGLTVTDLVLTKIGCTYVEWENYVSQSLVKAYLFTISGNSMVITTTGDFNLHFTKV